MECGIQYFSSEEEHKAKCNEGILVFSHNCNYKQGIIKFCQEHRIPYEMIDCPDPWVRDIFIETPTKLYIRNKNSKHSGQERLDRLGITIPPKEYTSDRNANADWPAMNGPDLRKINSSTFPAGYDIKPTNRALEGGNLFICENNSGVIYYIIGEYVLEGDYKIESHKRFLEHKPSVAYDPAKYIKHYETIFEIDNITSKILILPNLTYHLDLYIGYLARGIFIVNSFSDTLLRRNSPKPKSYDFKKIQALEVVEKLRQEDFVANTCDTTRYNDINKINTIWDGSANKLNYINGIPLTSNVDGKKYFLTLDSIHTISKLRVTTQLRRFSISFVFIKSDDLNPMETQEQAALNRGALRCQTIMLSKLSLANISAITIQKIYRGYQQRKNNYSKHGTVKNSGVSKISLRIDRSLDKYNANELARFKGLKKSKKPT